MGFQLRFFCSFYIFLLLFCYHTSHLYYDCMDGMAGMDGMDGIGFIIYFYILWIR